MKKPAEERAAFLSEQIRKEIATDDVLGPIADQIAAGRN
jgi:hypothetical protein